LDQAEPDKLFVSIDQCATETGLHARERSRCCAAGINDRICEFRQSGSHTPERQAIRQHWKRFNDFCQHWR